MKITRHELKRRFPKLTLLIDALWSEQPGVVAWSDTSDAEERGEHEIVFNKPMPHDLFEVFAEGRSGKKKITVHIIEDSKTADGFSAYVSDACTIVYQIIPHRV